LVEYDCFFDCLAFALAVFDSKTELVFFNKHYVDTFDFSHSWLSSKPTLNEIFEFLRQNKKIPDQKKFKDYKKKHFSLFNSVFPPFVEFLHCPDEKIFQMHICPNRDGGVLHIFNDISEKLTLEKKVNALIFQQRLIFDSLNEDILLCGIDSSILFINKSLREKFNLSLEELSNLESSFLSLQDLFQPRFSDLLNQMIFNNQPVTNLSIEELLNNSFIKKEPSQGSFISYMPLPDGNHFFSFRFIKPILFS
jgi:hypothetical protein